LKYNIDFIKGLSALAEGNIEKASVHMKAAALEKSDRIEAYFAAGLTFRKTGQYDRATYVMESILRSGDMDSATKKALTVELAHVMFEAGNFNIAVSLMEMTTDKEGMLLKAKALRKMDRFEEAANTYRSIAKTQKMNMDSEIGYCYYRCAIQAEDGRQSKYIKLAMKYIPRSRCLSMMIIDNLIVTAKNSRAMVEIERFISSGLPACLDDMIKFQTFFFDMKKLEDLMRITMKRIQEGSDNPYLYIYAVSRFLAGDNRAKAEETYKRYLDRFLMTNTIAKASLELHENQFLEKLLEDADFYRCTNCGTGQKSYRDTCPACQSFETLRPI